MKNKQTAREVYEKSCFGRKSPQNDILTCMCRLDIDYGERDKSFGMVQLDLKSVKYSKNKKENYSQTGKH